MNVAELHERLRVAGEEWADAESAASLLEETKKVVLAQIMSRHAGMSNAAAETVALADQQYSDHIGRMVHARKEANKARVRWESARAYVELLRTSEASRRAELQGLMR